MDRKIKIMGVYIGLLFFVSILLILITSFSYSEIDPSYEIEENKQHDTTLQQSVTKLTETNHNLSDKVLELNEKITLLEKELSFYKGEDFEKLKNIAFLIIDKNYKEAKTLMETVNVEILNDEAKKIYNYLLEELNF